MLKLAYAHINSPGLQSQSDVTPSASNGYPRCIIRVLVCVSKDAMSGQSDGQTPRSSTSSRPSASSSPTTNAGLDSNGYTDTPDNQTASSGNRHMLANSTNPTSNALEWDKDKDTQQEHEHIRKRPRHSGGFLLGSASPTSSRSTGKKGTLHEGPRNVKGKGKAEDADLIVPKRRSLLHRHRFKHSIGSSPLAKEVLNAAPTPGSDHNGRSDGDETVSVPSRASQSIRSSVGSDSTHNGLPSKDAGRDQDLTPSLGFDTDPTQLVNLALSLSESRRRNLSGGLLAPVNTLGARRVLSAGPSSAGIATVTGGGSLRQHLQQQRRISRNISPRTDRPGHRGTPSPRPSQAANVAIQAPIFPSLDLAGSPDLAFRPSDATLSRAEKARIALELGYEYRRLLQYLPKIPVPSKGRPTTGRVGRKENNEAFEEFGRPYNPLQYIRNRKVRLRERRPLDSEAEGWKDLARVRSWVDAVAGEREAGIATIDDRFPLPPFEVVPTQWSTVDPSPTPDTSHPNTFQISRPRRPRLDWTFTPWDMLADAYWLHHDENVTHIEDRAGHKILSSPQSFKARSARTSVEVDRATRKRSASTSRQAISPEKFRSLVDKTRKDTSRERGHQQQELSEPDTPTRHLDSFRDRKGRWPRRLVRSRSSSSLSESGHEDISSYRRRRRRDQNYLDSAALEKHMRKLLEQELEESGVPTSHQVDKDEKDGLKGNFNPGTLDENANGGLAHDQRSSTKEGQNPVRSSSTAWSAQPSARTSLDERRGRRPRVPSDDDLDAMAPSSPHVQNFVPSIAIDLSRANSPAASPRTPSPSRKDFRPARSKEREAISETDFATTMKQSLQLSRPGTRDSKSEEAAYRDRKANTVNGFLSPTTAEGFSRRFRRSEGKSTEGTNESNESESRFRGFFRGGRIAEIVGNEVSRVGERFWRKDASNQASKIPSPASSLSGESDTEGDGLDSSQEAMISPTATKTHGLSKANPEEPKYHMPNLPLFRSPFVKDKQNPGAAEQTLEEDAKQSQPLQQRERGRSSRFDRLAPPKLDMRNISPSSSPPLTRTQTRNTVASYDPFDSRQSSTSRSEDRVRDADRRLNAVLGIPGMIGRGGPPITGLATLESRQHRSREWPAPKGKQGWGIADRGVSAARGTVTKRDIARVRALLLSSGVKANEIARRAHEISERPSPAFHELQRISKEPLPRVPRSEEHNVVARIYASNIDDSNQQLRDTAERFSNETLGNLHKQIKDIDEQMTKTLTPSVRTCADEADAFSAQLTTTHVLEIKQLNDSVDAILRRRRRRLRWIRRGGYVLLEWTLLGIMWWVWLIVVIIRLIRGTIRGFFAAIRWLLWL